MNDDQAFDGNNPFAKLDPGLFRSGKDQAKKHAFTPHKDRGSARKDKDAETFLAAMDGIDRLKPVSSKKKRLHNPVLPPPAQPSPKAPPAAAPARSDKGTTAKQSPRKERTGESSAAVSHKPKDNKAKDNKTEYNEEAAFSSAMKGVVPLNGGGRALAPVTQPSPPLPEDENLLQDFMDGKINFSLESTDEYVEGHVLGLDLLTVGKLQAGQYSPESHIDLHGLNVEQAFERLKGFIKGAYLRGLRTVLIVPGRGRNSPLGVPVLRNKVQDWLTQDPFRRVVLAFCTAKISDGGAGALYVLLRKYRKDRGKVYWDRSPVDPDLTP